MTSLPLPQFLSWDSEHFGVRIARSDAPRTVAEADAIDDWALANTIACMYLFASGKDTAVIRLTEQRGARCMDERITLEAIVSDSPAVDGVRRANEADLPALEAIASHAFAESRFYRDPNFSRESCDSLYMKWIRKSVHGYAQAVLVSGDVGAPMGFVTCRDEKIDLLAVDESGRGKGIGRLLTAAAKHWFASHGARRVIVLARSRNDVAIRLYKRCGFVPASSEFVFHKWYKPSTT